MSGTATRGRTAHRPVGRARPPPPAPPTSGRAPRDTPRRAHRARPHRPAGAPGRRRRRACPPPRTRRTGPGPIRPEPAPPGRPPIAGAAPHRRRRGVPGASTSAPASAPACSRWWASASRTGPPVTGRGHPDHPGAPLEADPDRCGPPRRGSADTGGRLVGTARTARGDEAVRRKAGTGPAQRHAAHRARSSTPGGGPQPRTAAIGRSTTPGPGSTSSSTTHPPTRRGPQGDADLAPDAHRLGERGGNRVVEGLAQGAHIGEHPHDAFGVLRRHGGSLTRRWVGPECRRPTSTARGRA